MHLRALRCVTCTFVITAVAMLTFAAHAGEVLKLKKATVSVETKVLQPNKFSDFKGEFVVQFKSPIRAEDKQALKNAGLRILAYIPDDALVVYGSSRKVSELKLDSIRASLPFNPEWKMSEGFEPTSIFNGEKRTRVHIRTSASDFTQEIVKALSTLNGVTVRYSADRVVIADVPNSMMMEAVKLAGVEWLEPYVQLKTMDFDPGVAPQPRKQGMHFTGPTSTGYESGTRAIGFDAAWSRGFMGSGEVVGMTDTGLDTGDLSTVHQDLRNTKKASSVAKIPFVNLPVDDWSDTIGHGTHVAGSVVGMGNLSNGLIKGGANRASFIAQGVVLPDWLPAPLGGGLDPYALQNPEVTSGGVYTDGGRVHTNSWGGDTAGMGGVSAAYDAMAAAYDDYMWKNPDMLVIFAAGNSGLDKNRDGLIDPQSIATPGTGKNVLTVGASENLIDEGGYQIMYGQARPDENGNPRWGAEPVASDKMSNNINGLAAFSSRGPTADGRIKPDIVAPGTNIVSARSSVIKKDPQDPNRPPLWGVYDNNYLYCGGTSMATPLTAGAATVTREFLKKQMGVANPTGALVKAALLHTAYDMYPGQYGEGPKQEMATRRPNNQEGYGRVDMDKLTGMDSRTLVVDSRDGVGLGQDATFNVEASSGVTATLVYTDAPGSANAQKALVNDIDLIVQGPNGQSMSKNDHVNNVEMVEANMGSGSYTVRVKGVNIPNGKNGKQPFALLVTPN